MSSIIKIENAYEDGHASSTTVTVDDPVCPGHESTSGPIGVSVYCDGSCFTGLDDWWEEVVFPHTGDGHGADHPELGTFYTATVQRSDVRGLAGQTREWGG